MIAKDVVEQLVGLAYGGMDQWDKLSFSFYGCTKFNNETVDINFDLGTLKVTSGPRAGDEYAIIAKLEPRTYDT